MAAAADGSSVGSAEGLSSSGSSLALGANAGHVAVESSSPCVGTMPPSSLSPANAARAAHPCRLPPVSGKEGGGVRRPSDEGRRAAAAKEERRAADGRG
ncbi:Os11g0587850 [Oryza sativa Japonica Group]|uniref:Os11g0587850 protein n=1 Tax=Oryza sativa subsp. japonica TaxID=39947 RepID=A0A0P0Y3U8_ORYSJ|nr:Os11g0587850 [Oryza sativa Japonica Group]